MDLSILIVNWNTAPLLRQCLRALREATRSLGAVETIVVDNASRDGSADLVRNEFPAVRLIANSTNRNYAAGSNQALAAATGDRILLLNPDTVVGDAALLRLIRFLDAHPSAGGVAPRLVHPDGRTQPSVRGFPTPRALFAEVSGLARLFPRWGWATYRAAPPLDRPSRVEQPMASCLLLRGEALRAVGGFDEAFPLFWNDVDLCLRLHAAGWEIWYEPGAVVIHYGGASTRQVRLSAIWASHRGLHRLLAKHYRKQLPGPLYPLAIAGIYGAGVARVLLAAVGAAVARRPPPYPAPSEEALP